MRRLLLLRGIGIGVQVLVIITALYWLKLDLPIIPLTLILLLLSVWNFLSWRQVHYDLHFSDWTFFLQLSVDALAFTGMLYFSGGATNPFIWIFLLPVIIAATVLPGRFVWSMTAFTIICYSLLMRFYVPLNHVHAAHDSKFNEHVFGMWLGFILSASMIAYFVTNMAKSLRERDHSLAEAREQALRDEQLVAMGALAAGAAHELGTPLGTIALVSDELAEEFSAEQHPALNQKLNLIREQIIRCKQALSTISASAGEVRVEGGRSIDARTYLQQLLDHWQKQRPAVQLHRDIQGEEPSPMMIADQALTQALTNILNNAADASPEVVECLAYWDNDKLLIEIIDYGPGLSEAASATIGKAPFTSKSHGLGLGLFLAHATIERMGGKVTLFNREGGGVCTRIVLPIIPLPCETKA